MLSDMFHQEEEFLDGFTAEKFMVAMESNKKKKRKEKRNILPNRYFLHFATNVSSSVLPLCKQLRRLIKRSKQIIYIVSSILFRIIYKIKASSVNRE